MRFWGYSTRPRTCGKCNTAIPAGAVALRLTLEPSGAELWRCQGCAGPPPADVVLAVETPPSAALEARFLARLKDVIRTSLPDWKTRQSGDEAD